MSYQEVKIPDALKLTDYPDKPLQAYYIGCKQVNTQFGEQTIHEFQKDNGTKVFVWGFTALDRLLEHSPKGALTKVTYTGKSESKNKYGNKSHTCTVFFDEENKLSGFKEIIEPEDKLKEDNQELPF